MLKPGNSEASQLGLLPYLARESGVLSKQADARSRIRLADEPSGSLPGRRVRHRGRSGSRRRAPQGQRRRETGQSDPPQRVRLSPRSRGRPLRGPLSRAMRAGAVLGDSAGSSISLQRLDELIDNRTGGVSRRRPVALRLDVGHPIGQRSRRDCSRSRLSRVCR